MIQINDISLNAIPKFFILLWKFDLYLTTDSNYDNETTSHNTIQGYFFRMYPPCHCSRSLCFLLSLHQSAKNTNCHG